MVAASTMIFGLSSWLSASGMRNFTFSGSDAIPQASDCAVRTAAWQYGRKLQPQKGSFRTLFDALQLDACGVPPPPPSAADGWLPPRHSQHSQQHAQHAGGSSSSGQQNWGQQQQHHHQRILIVDPTLSTGDLLPRGRGGQRKRTDRFATIGEAVAASRTLPKPLTIALKEGVHYLTSPVELGASDSGLTIRNVENEFAVVSGGVNLTTPWKPSKACKGCWQASLKGQVSNVLGLRRDGVREIRARFPNHDPELNAVIDGQYLVHDGRAGMVNTSGGAWLFKGAPHMNGINGTWPPSDHPATTYVVSAADWPGVDWPMAIMTNTSNGTCECPAATHVLWFEASRVTMWVDRAAPCQTPTGIAGQVRGIGGSIGWGWAGRAQIARPQRATGAHPGPHAKFLNLRTRLASC
jgi:hypothetical protein